jgi:hypothetical protein
LELEGCSLFLRERSLWKDLQYPTRLSPARGVKT